MDEMNLTLARQDPEIHAAVRSELRRQNDQIELIASENYVSLAVLEAQGSVLTNKYAEGYPGRRYYGGCEFVDVVEDVAIDRARRLFGADYANVQPHSGSSANMAVYFAHCQPGETILAMSLAHGGHLTHGAPVSFSGRLFNFVHYGVSRETEMIDFDQVRDLAKKTKPRLIVAGASAYPRLLDFELFGEIAAEVGAAFMVDMAHIAGLVAGGVHPSPIPHADYVTTTTHKTLRGPRGGLILAKSDYAAELNKQIFPGIQGGPLMHVIAAKAVALGEALAPGFADYSAQVVRNAQALARGLAEAGLRLVSGGTDNHLLLLDVTPLGLTGDKAETALEAAGITANKNAIPFDPKPPKVTSGLRMGTPALTTRGFKEPEMELLAGLIVKVLRDPGSDEIKETVRRDVAELCRSFPMYHHLAEI